MTGACMRVPFTKQDESHLVRYLATCTADGKKRAGNQVYQNLVNDSEKPWAGRHPWQSWRDHYCKHKTELDRYIYRCQKKKNMDPPPPSATPAENSSSQRNNFTEKEDRLLARYIAKQGAHKARSESLYKTLVENQEKWAWASRHTWQSWKQRYKNNCNTLDPLIRKHQKRYGLGLFQSPVKTEPLDAVENQVEDNGRVLLEREGTVAAGNDDEEARARENGKKRRRSGEQADETRSKRRRVQEAPDLHLQRYQEVGPANAPVEVKVEPVEDAGVVGDEGGIPDLDALAEQAEVVRVEEELTMVAEEPLVEEEDEQHLAPPASDDYRGEIFDDDMPDRAKELMVAEEDEQHLAPPASNDYRREVLDEEGPDREPDAPQWEHLSGEQDGVLEGDVDTDDEADQLPDEVYDVLGQNAERESPVDVDDETGLTYNKASTLGPSVPKGVIDETPGDRLYPDVPSPPHSVRVEPSLPGAYPATRAPNRQVPSRASSAHHSIMSPSMQRIMKPQLSQDPSSPGYPPEHTPVRSAAPSPRTTRRGVYAPTPAPPPESSPAPRPSSARRQAVHAAEDTQVGPSSISFNTSTPRSPNKARLSKVPEPHFFESASGTPSADRSRAPSPVERRRIREPPRLDEGAFNSAYTDAHGRHRVSPGGRAYGVDEEELVGSSALQELQWPPKRDRKGKGKELGIPVSTEHTPMPATTGKAHPAVTRTAVQVTVMVKEEPSHSQLLSSGVNESRSFLAVAARGHHPFSQFPIPSQDMVPLHHYALEQPLNGQVEHHPFSQVTPSTVIRSSPSAASISAALDELLDADVAIGPQLDAPAPKTHLSNEDLLYLDEMVKENADLLQQEIDEIDEVYLPAQSAEPSPVGSLARSLHAERLESSPARLPSLRVSPAEPDDLVADDSWNGMVNVSNDHELANVPNEQQEVQPVARLHPQKPRRRYTLPAHHGKSSRLYPHQGSRDASVAQGFQAFSSNMEWAFRSPLVRTMYQQGRPPPYSLEDMCGLTAALLAELSKKYGFTEEVVLETWVAAGSLSEAERWLAEIHRSAERTSDALKERSIILEDSARAEDSAGAERRQSTLSADQALNRRPTSRKSRHSNSSSSSVLHITPLPHDEPEYIPHPDSRAGQYVRRAKESRRDDARGDTSRTSSSQEHISLRRLQTRRSTNGEDDARDVERLLDGVNDGVDAP